MKAKKRASFAKIYLMAVSAFIMLCVIVYIVLAVMLNRYEQKAGQKRLAEKQIAESAQAAEEESRIAESERIKQELEEERQAKLRKEEDFNKRQNAAASAAEGAVSAIKNAAAKLSGVSAESFVRSLTETLNKDGSSLLSDMCGSAIGEYEKENALAAYADGLPGEYAYEMTSPLSAKIGKSGLYFEITLSETLKDGFLPEYSVKDASCRIKLRSYTVTVPAGAVLTVNGKTAKQTSPDEKTENVKDVPDAFNPPKIAVYALDGFINEPDISVSLDGKELICEKTGGSVYYREKDPYSDKTELYSEELTERIISLTFDYTDFIAGIYKFSQVKKNFYPDTKLYTALSGFDNRWYYTYDHIVNEDVKVSGFTVLSDRLVTARVVYYQTLYDIDENRLRRLSMKFDVTVGCPTDVKMPDKNKNYSSWVLIAINTQ